MPMKRAVPQVFQNLPAKLKRRINWSSLEVQLTLGIGTLFALSLSSVAIWTCWKMQRILIESHKKNVFTVASQVTEDITFYSEMLPMNKSLQKAIDNRASRNLLLWIEKEDASLVAAPAITGPAWQRVGHPSDLAQTFQKGSLFDLYQVQDRELVACRSPLVIGTQTLGTLFVAQDITQDQRRINDNIQTLVLATSLAMILSLFAIAYFIRRSLQPLFQMQAMTQKISAEDLGHAQVVLPKASSEIQSLANTFNMMLARLSEAWAQQHHIGERQRQFASDVSHELRTPLTIVRGYLQSTLRRSDNLLDHQREALEVAAGEADHTIQLLQDLLNLARADDGYMAYDLQILILNDVVTGVVQVAEQFSHRTILVEAKASLIPIYADANRLHQILVNLVENALKYSDEAEPVRIKLEQVDKQAVIQVCDRGPGIPLQQQSRIFDRFYRLDEARTRSMGGTGLGLSIVKVFVEGMGGQVTVRSELNEGSTFTVTLPISAVSL
ncbi:Signal transduction histidine-protein kinase ArlS [Acaryochloris thomasi RCC1774]|uniref:histidine kinase n=1 Tax=Acaryochloris thomasi RCC1774 TaxID=1764569 RepID=A0A2W1JTT1_9CYAN|nr:HAMP domain-containing sensor histidine kinase [Acaryochloris thomasi]PZD72027.1 Signal transduction histidine-protein kinase ArlS [Acaryochloris thomasi RCC1774]